MQRRRINDREQVVPREVLPEVRQEQAARGMKQVSRPGERQQDQCDRAGQEKSVEAELLHPGLAKS